jgi:hypothetical protein
MALRSCSVAWPIAATHGQHQHVDEPPTGLVRWRSRLLDQQQAPLVPDRASDRPQDLLSVAVIPGAQDLGQAIDVSAGRHARKEAPSHDLTATGPGPQRRSA